MAVFGYAFAQEPEASRRVYAVTAPYLTVTDDISFDALKCLWDGSCPVLEGTDYIFEISIAEDELDPLVTVEPEARPRHRLRAVFGQHFRPLNRIDFFSDACNGGERF